MSPSNLLEKRVSEKTDKVRPPERLYDDAKKLGDVPAVDKGGSMAKKKVGPEKPILGKTVIT